MRRRDAAFSLMEMIVAMGVLSILVSLSCVLMFSGLKASRAAAKAAERLRNNQAALERIGMDVRRTVRFGPSDARTLTLQTVDSGSVIYRVEDGVLIRETTRDGKPRRVPAARIDAIAFSMQDAPERSQWVEVELSGGEQSRYTRRFWRMDAEVQP